MKKQIIIGTLLFLISECYFGRRKNPLDLYQPWQINLIHTMHLNFYIGAESVWEN